MVNMKDSRGREARYLRISITDRCNFHCIYCRDSRRLENIPHQNILRYEEISRFVNIMRDKGIGKVRITGGEPFARKNCAQFLLNLHKAYEDLRICITTNGSLLEPWLEELKKISPESINISLDSFDKDTFNKITGHNALPLVLKNIERLLSMDLRIKLNAVALRGITDKELDNFIHAVREMPVDIRFIEFMPMGATTRWTPEMFLPTNEILKLIREKVSLNEADEQNFSGLAGPARLYSFAGARGRLGFISALSDHFCGQCNRLRLTSDGKLRTCLFSDKEYALANMLRNAKVSNRSIALAVSAAHKRKPLGADLLRARKKAAVADREMSGIGG